MSSNTESQSAEQRDVCLLLDEMIDRVVQSGELMVI
jgi:hypothetical protein